jgi:hypothetical protein
VALIDCPECERAVSSEADSCPDCGYPIKGMQVETVSSKGMSLSARTALGWDLAYRNAWKVGLVLPVVSLVQLGFGLLLEDALAGRAIDWADVGSTMLF